MGYDLSHWAQTVEHPCLTPRTRQVLNAICMVAHDEHGEFWMRATRLIREYLPDMSYGGYRNCVSRLVTNGLLIKTEQGGGRTSNGRGTTTRYRVNSPVVRNPHPEQGVLPEITRSSEAQPPTLEASNESHTTSAVDVYQRVEGLLVAGITPDQMLAILKVVEDTMTGSRDVSDSPQNLTHSDGETCNDSGKPITNHDRFDRNVSQSMTGFDRETCNDSEKPVTNHDRFDRNLSQSMTPHPIHEEKDHEEKEDHAAAACEVNLSSSVTGFFDQLAIALADAGYSGIRTAQFADLTGFLAEYTNVTGSPPDQRTADYIVGRVSETAGIRNVAAFVRRLARDVLTTGEGFVAYEPPPPAPPTERSSEPLPPPDWAVLHLSHVEQVSPPQEVWDSVLESLRGQVSRPAFETWLSASSGAAYADGQFVVGTANSFTSEMLRNRMHPLINKAVRDVVGVDLGIQYVVAPLEGRGECPICRAGEARTEAS